LDIDLSIKDSQGNSVKERLLKMMPEYERYREYDKNFWKSKPENHNFLTSEIIMKLIE